MRSTAATTVLLHIADSAYPTGAFAHSGGLEYAVRCGWVHDEPSLLRWATEALSHSVRTLDGLAAVQAWRHAGAADLAGLVKLNRRLAAFRSAGQARDAQAQMGRSLLEITAAAYPAPRIDDLRSFVPDTVRAGVGPVPDVGWIQSAVAWGAVCCWLGIGERDCLDALLFGVARQWAQAAVRTVPLGQTAANRVLAAVGRTAAALAPLDPDLPLRSFAPGLEIAAMGQGSLPARYFRS